MIDAGASPAHARAFLDAAALLDVPPIRFLTYTHWHWDHVWGAAEVVAACQPIVVANQLTSTLLVKQQQLAWDDESLDARVEAGVETAFCRDHMKREMPCRHGLRLIAPNVVYTDKIKIDLGGVTCVVEHVGGDHASDASVVFVEEAGVLFAGDSLYPSIYTRTPEYTLTSLLRVTERLAAYEAQTIFLSHTAMPFGGDYLAALAKLYIEIGQRVVEQSVTPNDIAAHFDRVGLGLPIPPEVILEVAEAFANGAEAVKADQP